ncbi:MAG: CCA tRNA nucleotidyltransferase [Thermosynechococcaceae cyanobacterium]
MLLTSPLLQSSVLCPQYWPFSLDWIPQTAYLVGGCVRDALLGYGSPYLDLDFVLPQHSIETAQAIAHHYRAGFVVLDETHQIARVVFERATADFALQVGTTLQEDLRRRDFTINAIAYSPHTQTLFDPLAGQTDLERRVLRMISVENLADDPLRLFRAYRQAAQLHFEIDPATHAQIIDFAPRLSRIAAERIRSELGYLLSHGAGSSWIKRLWQDGLLQSSFPDASESGLDLIASMDQAEVTATARWPQLESLLHRTLSARPKSGEGVRRTLFATAKLVGLVSSEVQLAKLTLQRMKYSRAEVNVALTVLQGLTQLQSELAQGAMDRRQQYHLCRTVGEAFPAVAVAAIAADLPLPLLAPLVEEYLNPLSAIAHPKPLVSGQDLMVALAIPSGPMVGQLLSVLELAQAEGRIATPEAALQLARQWVDRPLI